MPYSSFFSAASESAIASEEARIAGLLVRRTRANVRGGAQTAFEKDLGSKELLARASYIRSTAHEHTADHLLRNLKGENVRPGEFSRLRIRKGRGTKRLIIECDHAEFLFRYRCEMEAALNQVVRKLTVSPETDETMRTVLYPFLESMRRGAGR